MATVNLGDFYFNGPGATNENSVGYFGGSKSQLCIRLSQTYDIQTNKSTVSVTNVWFTYDGARGGSISAIPYFYIYINDEVIATLGDGNQVIYNPSSDSGWVEFTNISGTSSLIQHNTDGTKSVDLKVVRLNNQWADAVVWLNEGWNIGSCYVTSTSGGTKTVTLQQIPRASSITSASNVTIKNACSVTWTPLSTSFRYRLFFSLGSWSGYTGVINPGTTSSYTYTGYAIPEDVAYQLPNSTTGTMTVTLRTYSDAGGNTQVGSDSSKTFTVTVPAYTVSWTTPVAASLVNSNSTIAGWNVAVQGYTAVKLSGGASGKYGSTISYYTISGGYSITRTGTSLDYTGSKINTSGNVSFNVVAVDSRGRSSSATTVTVYFYPYSPPTISSFTAYRSSSNKESVTAKGVWSYSRVGNNSASGTVYYKLSTGSSWIAHDSITSNAEKTLSWTFSTMSSYDVRLFVKDSLDGTAEYTIRIPTDAITLHLAQGGSGVGIGKYAEVDNLLDVEWDTQIRGALQVDKAAKLIGGSYSHGANAGPGQAGYIKIAVITVVMAYVNMPITMTICQRGKAVPSTIYILLSSTSTTSPSLLSVYGNGHSLSNIWVAHPSDGVFEVWVKKNESWDQIDVIDYHKPPYLNEGIIIEWTNEYSDTQPTGTQPTAI